MILAVTLIASALALGVYLVWLRQKVRIEQGAPLRQKDLTLEEQKQLLRYVRQHKACNGTGRKGYYDIPNKKIPYPCDCIEKGIKRIQKARENTHAT